MDLDLSVIWDHHPRRQVAATGARQQVASRGSPQQVASKGVRQQVALMGSPQQVLNKGMQQQVTAMGAKQQEKVASEYLRQQFAPKRVRQQVASKGTPEQVASKGTRQLMASTPKDTRLQVTGKGLRQQVAGKGVRHAVSSSGGRQDLSCSNGSNTCCVIDQGQRCHQSAGRKEYSEAEERLISSIRTKTVKLKSDSRAKHRNMCEYHQTKVKDLLGALKEIRSPSTSEYTESNDEDDIDEDEDKLKIDFNRLSLTTLQKYKENFIIPGDFSNKAELADAVTKHFRTIPIPTKDELREIVADFIFKLKYCDTLPSKP